MKTRTITLKGWANHTNYMCSPNVKSTTFDEAFNKVERELISNGYKRLALFNTLHGRGAAEKVVIKGWYWRGSWASPDKQTVCIYYK